MSSFSFSWHLWLLKSNLFPPLIILKDCVFHGLNSLLVFFFFFLTRSGWFYKKGGLSFHYSMACYWTVCYQYFLSADANMAWDARNLSHGFPIRWDVSKQGLTVFANSSFIHPFKNYCTEVWLLIIVLKIDKQWGPTVLAQKLLNIL